MPALVHQSWAVCGVPDASCSQDLLPEISVHGVQECARKYTWGVHLLALPMVLPLPALQCASGTTGSQCYCLYVHTHTHAHENYSGPLKCALASGCSPSPEASENPHSVSELELFAVSSFVYEPIEYVTGEYRSIQQQSYPGPKRLPISALMV